MMKKFIEFVGNGSTSAMRNGKNLGYNVSVARYSDGDKVILTLESNGSRVRGVSDIIMTSDQFDDFYYKNDNTPLFARAIHLFNAETMFE